MNSRKLSFTISFAVVCCIMLIEIILGLLNKYGYYKLPNIGIHIIIFSISYLIVGFTASKIVVERILPRIPFFNKTTKTPHQIKRVPFVILIFMVFTGYFTWLLMQLFDLLKLDIDKNALSFMLTLVSFISSFGMVKSIGDIDKTDDNNIDQYGVNILKKSAIILIVLGTIIYTILSGLKINYLPEAFALSYLSFFMLVAYARINSDAPNQKEESSS